MTITVKTKIKHGVLTINQKWPERAILLGANRRLGSFDWVVVAVEDEMGTPSFH
jgi:hypothetical protein